MKRHPERGEIQQHGQGLTRHFSGTRCWESRLKGGAILTEHLKSPALWAEAPQSMLSLINWQSWFFFCFIPVLLCLFRATKFVHFSATTKRHFFSRCFLFSFPMKSITLCAHAGDIISITFSACFGLPAGTVCPILDCKRQRALSLSGSSSLVIIYSGGDNFLGTMPPSPHLSYTLGDHLLVSLRKARQCHKSTIFLCTGGRTQNGTRKREMEFIFILWTSRRNENKKDKGKSGEQL